MISYKVYKNTNFEFWGYAGWFFASRQVEKEIGSKIHADKNMHWILAFSDNKCIGISGIKFCKNHTEFKHSYVIHDYRKMGIYTQFSKMRLDITRERGYSKAKVSCTDMSKNIIISLGFTKTGKRGRYTTFEYDFTYRVDKQ